MIAIRNNGKKTYILILPHGEYCAKAHKCFCDVVSGISSKRQPDGSLKAVETQKKLPKSFHLRKGEKSPYLHRSVLDLPGIAQLMKTGVLSVIDGEETEKKNKGKSDIPKPPKRTKQNKNK